MIGIIGSGPAGLAAACALADFDQKFVLFEQGCGHDLRDHKDGAFLGSGVGGCGLFSDGKFSFFPSGSNLYHLRDKARLGAALDWTAIQLASVGISTDGLLPPQKGSIPVSVNMPQKVYPSAHGSLQQRMQLIDRLVSSWPDSSVCSNKQIIGLRKIGSEYVVTFKDIDDCRLDESIFTDLIIATGRFGPIALKAMTQTRLIDFEKQRYEIGIRIEHPSGLGFMGRISERDVKFIFDIGGVQLRTFCTCRNGELWHIPYDQFSALSGRSDGPPSQFSNFGLLARYSGQRFERGQQIWTRFLEEFRDARVAVWQPIEEFLRMPSKAISKISLSDRSCMPQKSFRTDDFVAHMHPDLVHDLCEGIKRLGAISPDLISPDTICVFPAIEGVGEYPVLDNDLRVPGEQIWCCGDIVGRFRGVVPAMVSGYFAGLAITSQSCRI